MNIKSSDSPTNTQSRPEDWCTPLAGGWLHQWLLPTTLTSVLLQPAFSVFPPKSTNKNRRLSSVWKRFRSVQSWPGLDGPVRLQLFAVVVKTLFIVTAVSISDVNTGLVLRRSRRCDLAPCLQLGSTLYRPTTAQHVFFFIEQTSRFGFWDLIWVRGCVFVLLGCLLRGSPSAAYGCCFLQAVYKQRHGCEYKWVFRKEQPTHNPSVCRCEDTPPLWPRCQGLQP